MSKELDHEIEHKAREVSGFFQAARSIGPSVITLAIVGVTWFFAAQHTANEEGKKEQRLVGLEEDVALMRSENAVLISRINAHDVTLGVFDEKLDNIEETTKATYTMVLGLTRNR